MRAISLNVTMITSTFLPSIGGAELSIAFLSKALIKLGVNVKIIAPYSRRNLSIKNLGLLEHCLNVKRVPLIPKLTFSPLLYGLLRYALDSDVIHAHFLYPPGFASALYSATFAKPYIVTMHGIDILVNKSIGYGERLDPIINMLIKFVLRDADMLIAPSKLVAKEAIKVGAHPSKVKIIPNGVDIEKFNPNLRMDVARSKLGFVSADHVVLNVANFRKVKGHECLVEAIPHILKECPNTIFVFVGDGPERSKIIQKVKNLGVHRKTVFTGSVPYDVMPFYYAAADVFVLSSISENFPLTVLEAVASGKPVVAPPIGAIPEIVRDGVSGILVPSRDSLAYANAIIAILKDKSFAKNAIKFHDIIAKEYSWDSIAKKTLKLYMQLLKK